MTTLEKIVKKAQALKKSYPNKFAKWTDYVKEASKEFRSTTTTKKKSKLAGVKKKAPKKVVSKKLTSKKASDLIRAEVKSKKFIMPHGYEVRKSKLAGIKKQFNPKSLIGKEVFKSVGAKDVYTITEIEQITPNNIKMTLEKDTFSTQESYTIQNLIDLSKGKIVKNLKLLDQISGLPSATQQKNLWLIGKEKEAWNLFLKGGNKFNYTFKSYKSLMDYALKKIKPNLAGSKITPAEHYLSYAPPSKPSEQQIYKGIERVKQDILRLQAMQKDHMFKKHKASLNGAINTKNREIKELLNKLK
jgi:hypothetical protein